MLAYVRWVFVAGEILGKPPCLVPLSCTSALCFVPFFACLCYYFVIFVAETHHGLYKYKLMGWTRKSFIRFLYSIALRTFSHSPLKMYTVTTVLESASIVVYNYAAKQNMLILIQISCCIVNKSSIPLRNCLWKYCWIS